MFKNNKIKKLLAFSIISSGILLCGSNAYAVKIPANFNSGNPSDPLKGPVRRPVFSYTKFLKDLKTGNGGEHGKYIIFNQSNLLVDLLEETRGVVRRLGPNALECVKNLYRNDIDVS